MINAEKFVRESNAIEGITAEKGDLEYDNHLAAVKKIIKNFDVKYVEFDWVRIALDIHKELMLGILDRKHCGRYRNCLVRVGNSVPPIPKFVHPLLEYWSKESNTAIQKAKKYDVTKDINDLHYMFENTHPFVDGNGRTGRAVRLAQQLVCQMKPDIILYTKRNNYYDSISKWGGTFRKRQEEACSVYKLIKDFNEGWL